MSSVLTVALSLALQAAPAAAGNALGSFFQNILTQIIEPALPYIAALFVALVGLGYIWAHGNPANQERLRSALGGIVFGVFLVASATGLVAMVVASGKIA